MLATPSQRRYHESNPTTQTKAIVSREMQIAVHLHTGRGIWSRTWVGCWLFRHVAVLLCQYCLILICPRQNWLTVEQPKTSTQPKSTNRCPTLYRLQTAAVVGHERVSVWARRRRDNAHRRGEVALLPAARRRHPGRRNHVGRVSAGLPHGGPGQIQRYRSYSNKAGVTTKQNLSQNLYRLCSEQSYTECDQYVKRLQERFPF